MEADKTKQDEIDYRERASLLFFQMKLETIVAEPAFDDLLEFAAQTCLDNPDAVGLYAKELEATREHTEQHKLVSHLGNWGLRAAIELQEHANTFFSLESVNGKDNTTKGDNKSKPKKYSPFTINTILEYPRSLHTERNPEIVDKVEAFGRAILDEAFAVLGPDAPEKILEFQQAEDKQGKVVVIEWLIHRIRDIRDDARLPVEEETQVEVGEFSGLVQRVADDTEPTTVSLEEIPIRLVTLPEETQPEANEQDDQDYYHPVRLSPKLIGAYPNMQLSPTCLGISILAAAFFERAGVPYFHGGVMASAQEQGRQTQIASITTIKKAAAAWGLEIPDLADQKLRKLTEELEKITDRDRGHHAAVVVGTEPGQWLVLDPNYSTAIYLYNDEMAKLEELYKLHVELHKFGADVEHAVSFDDGFSAIVFIKLLSQITEADVPMEIISDFIKAASAAEDPLEVFKSYLLFFLTRQEGLEKYDLENDDVSLADMIFDDFLSRRAGYKWNHKQKFIDNVMEQVLFTYVFPDAKDNDLAKCLERCETDMEYRQRRLEDLKFAPLYLVYKMHKHFVDNAERMNMAPAKMEIGLPHFRVGMSVLSDFAVYGGDNLPPSFWASYWPSHTVLADHIVGRKVSQAQKTIGWNLSEVITSGTLQYMSTHGIIQKFLEQERSDENVSGE